MPHPIWPLFDLEITTPLLTLRYVDDGLATDLARLASAGIHDPAWMPFVVPWTDHPAPTLEVETLRYHWQRRAATQPAAWSLLFAVLADDIVIGTAELWATDFATIGAVETGSWLGRDFQGRGFGKEMRRALLALGFDGFGARTAHTAAWADNAASIGVTRSLGYSEEGRRLALRRADRDELVGFRMGRDAFDLLDTDDVTFAGLDRTRSFLEID